MKKILLPLLIIFFLALGAFSFAPVKAKAITLGELEDLKAQVSILIQEIANLKLLLTGQVFAFGVSAAYAQSAPTVTADAATNITQTQVELNGSVNPNNGGDTAAWFDFGGNDVGNQIIPDGSSAVSMTPYLMTGLTCGTNYTFMVEAINGSGPANPATGNFTTLSCTPPPQPPTVVNASVSNIAETTITFNGTINPNNGGDTAAWFDFGGTDYGNQIIPDGGSDITMTPYLMTGLTCNTSYTFMVEAVNGAGPANPFTIPPFTTDPCGGGGGNPPTVTADTPTNITQTSVELNGSVNPNNGGDTAAWFDFGGIDYGNQLISDGSSAVTMTLYSLSGLTCGTNYTFMVEAVNAAGPATDTQNFTTATCDAPPTITTTVTETCPLIISRQNYQGTRYESCIKNLQNLTVLKADAWVGSITCAKWMSITGKTSCFFTPDAIKSAAAAPVTPTAIIPLPSGTGSITIVKDVIPGIDSQNFIFTAVKPANTFENFTLDDDPNSSIPQQHALKVLPLGGTYTIEETIILGWSVFSSCLANGQEYVTGSHSITFVHQPGMNIVCTFTNFKPKERDHLHLVDYDVAIKNLSKDPNKGFTSSIVTYLDGPYVWGGQIDCRLRFGEGYKVLGGGYFLNFKDSVIDDILDGPPLPVFNYVPILNAPTYPGLYEVYIYDPQEQIEGGTLYATCAREEDAQENPTNHFPF